MKIKYTCKLCNKEFESVRNFVRHLKVHKISSREYYDTFLKQDNEGICQVCGKPTKFFKFAIGYRKTCSDNCYRQLCVKNWHKTMNEKYNGGYYAGTIECQNRMKETCKEKYGCEYVWQSDEIKEKRKNSMLERYGVEHTMQNEEFKTIAKQHREETNLEKYGVKHNWASEELREKGQYKTCEEKYGYKYTGQIPEIQRKMKCNYHAPNGKIYDSSWEYLFEQYLIKNNISYIYQSDLTLTWTDVDGKEHKYIPDFLILNDKKELIEIKGDQFFDNTGTFINPYDKSEKGYANAKLKWECMMNAGVKVYTSKELKNLGIII